MKLYPVIPRGYSRSEADMASIAGWSEIKNDSYLFELSERRARSRRNGAAPGRREKPLPERTEGRSVKRRRREEETRERGIGFRVTEKTKAARGMRGLARAVFGVRSITGDLFLLPHGRVK